MAIPTAAAAMALAAVVGFGGFQFDPTGALSPLTRDSAGTDATFDSDSVAKDNADSDQGVSGLGESRAVRLQDLLLEGFVPSPDGAAIPGLASANGGRGIQVPGNAEPIVTPADTVENTDASGGGRLPNANDPDPAGNRLPSDPDDGDSAAHAPSHLDPNAGIETEDEGTVLTPVPDFHTELDVHDTDDAYMTLGIEPLYQGMYLDNQKILRTGYFYVDMVDANNVVHETYRLTEFGDNFRVGQYPEVIALGTTELKVKFWFRADSSSEWLETTVTFPVSEGKLRLGSYEAGEYVYQAGHAVGDVVRLQDYFAGMHGITLLAGDAPVALSRLFPGWTDSATGDWAGGTFEITSAGVTTLDPLSLVDVPDDMDVVLAKTDAYARQVLVAYRGDTSSDCIIPDGVQVIDGAYRTGADASDHAAVVARTISIPRTVETIAPASLTASESYSVDENNETFFSSNGILCQRDASLGGVRVVGIPTDVENIRLSAEVRGMCLCGATNLSSIYVSGEPADLDDMELDRLENVQVFVPENLYPQYLAAWGAHPGNASNSLMIEGVGEPEYVERDGAVLSADGTVLALLDDGQIGTFVVPDGVTSVAAGAFGTADVEDVVLTAGVSYVAEGAFGASVKTVMVRDSALLAADPDAFAGLELQVPSAYYDDYQAWAAAGTAADSGAAADPADDSGAERVRIVANDFALLNQDGYQLLVDHFAAGEKNETVLLSAPASDRFDADCLPGVTVTAIDSGAFAGSSQLAVVDLPQSVDRIGARAFADCTGLKVFFSQADGRLDLGKDFLAGCKSLRIVAFNAREVSTAGLQASLPITTYYIPAGATGYDPIASMYVRLDARADRYDLASQNGGYVLYGLCGDGSAVPGWEVVRATTDVTGELTFVHDVTSIGAEAFDACTRPLTIGEGELSGVVFIGQSAFRRAGLSGSLVLPATLDELGASAFTSTGVTSVTFEGAGPAVIGASAFASCRNLSVVTFAADSAVTQIGNRAFASTAIASIELPQSLEVIGNGAFSGCTGLAQIDLPASVTSIGTTPFGGTAAAPTVVTVRSAVPASLTSSFSAYRFSSVGTTYHVVLAGDAVGCEQAYVDSWKYAFAGRPYGSQLSEAEEQRATNAVLALFN